MLLTCVRVKGAVSSVLLASQRCLFFQPIIAPRGFDAVDMSANYMK